MKAPIRSESAVNTEKAAAAFRACSAASADTVARIAVASGTVATADAARVKKVAIRTVAKAHAKKPWAVSQKKNTSSVLMPTISCVDDLSNSRPEQKLTTE
jgi:hypothetical protein